MIGASKYCFDTRITPAGAGKTTYHAAAAVWGWDHPRRCGENHGYTVHVPQYRGSPPQVRGKRCRRERDCDDSRITPAGAGKTSDLCLQRQDGQDHPRGCGENRFLFLRVRAARGSPPRMRGKPISGLTGVTANRITPADAGKTSLFFPLGILRRDHPRGCGENPLRRGFLAYCLGSPPRMRGKPSKIWSRRHSRRITPAHAGKTFVVRHSKSVDQDHPRGCGENTNRNSRTSHTRGSPPQVRGKPRSSASPRFFNRITPAGTGKTGYLNFMRYLG